MSQPAQTEGAAFVGAGPGSTMRSELSVVRFEVLDGLRGIGAIMVLIIHTTLLFPSTNLAVDMFFMLSGFVLAHGYGEKLATAHERKRYVITRIIRIWPLYLVGCAMALAPTLGMALFGWGFWTIPVWLLAVATAPFFIILPYDTFSIPLNPPGWSLSFELMANFVFMFTATRLRPVLAVIAVAAAGLLYALYHTHGGYTSGWLSFWGSFPRVFYSFFMGVLLHRLWRSGRFVPPAVPAILVLLAEVLICVSTPPMLRTYYAAILFVGNPLLIYLAAHSTASGVLAKFCKLIGDCSFALYVIHVPVIFAVEGVRFLLLQGSDAGAYQTNLGGWWISQPLSCIIAWYLTYHWDVPVRGRLMRRFVPRPAGPALG